MLFHFPWATARLCPEPSKVFSFLIQRLMFISSTSHLWLLSSLCFQLPRQVKRYPSWIQFAFPNDAEHPTWFDHACGSTYISISLCFPHSQGPLFIHSSFTTFFYVRHMSFNISVSKTSLHVCVTFSIFDEGIIICTFNLLHYTSS